MEEIMVGGGSRLEIGTHSNMNYVPGAIRVADK